MATKSLFLPDTYSQMGRATGGHLENLRRQLGIGIDPAYDYSGMQEVQKKVTEKKKEKKTREDKESGGALDELRLALEKSQAPTFQIGEDAAAGDGGAEGSPREGGAKESSKKVPQRPSRAFLAPSRRELNERDVTAKFRAPAVGTYRPKMDLVDPRQKGADFIKRSPSQSRKALEVEKEAAEWQAMGRSIDDFSKTSISVDHLDDPPERLKKRQADLDFSKQTERPDMVKSSGLKFNDNSFTTGLLEGDTATSKLSRNPSWDFARLSTTEDKPRDTFFQPGQYKVEEGLGATRTRTEVKNISFDRQRKRKDLVETVGLFEIKSRLGDHLPDRSYSRSCPVLSSAKKSNATSFDHYSDRRPLIETAKPYHKEEDPHVDQAVFLHSLSHDEMEAAKTTWSKVRTGSKFHTHLKREEHLRTQRSYGNDVCLRMAKDNNLRGPVSVELLEDVGTSPQLRPRVLSRDFERMVPREAKEGKYRDYPSRGKDMTDALRFERGARMGEGRAPTEVLSPSSGAIVERRKARTYTALEVDCL